MSSSERRGEPPRRRRVSQLMAPVLAGGLVIAISVIALGTVTQARQGHATSTKTATSTATPSRTTKAKATPKGGLVTTPIASAGCGIAPAIAAGTSAEVSVVSGNQKRAYRLHIPTGYDASTNWPLIVDYHGGQSTDAMYEHYSGQSVDADRDGFLVAYPQGLPGSNSYGWGGTGVGQPNVDDVLFTSDLISSIQNAYCVDPHRIFIMGYSRGGGMASILACRLSQRIAAFAIVSGTYLASIENSCAPSRPVSIVEFHGTGDPTAPYQGGGAENFLPVPTWLNNWVARDGCIGGPATFLQQSGVTGEAWTNCKDGVELQHFEIAGWGHQWMHGASGTHPLDDTTAAWQFFVAHPLMTSQPTAR